MSLQAQQHRNIRGRNFVLAGLIALAMGANILGPSLFWGVRQSEVLQFVAFVALGALVAEVCLLSIWSALGAQAVMLRVPISLGLLIAATCAFLMGLQLPGDEMPFDSAIGIGATSIMMFCCVQVPLLGVRAKWHRTIDWGAPGSVSIRHESAQFGLRYLLVFTTLVGVLLMMVKQSLPAGRFANSIPLAETIAVMFVIMVFSTLICLPCVWLALSTGRPLVWLVWLAVVGLAGPPVVVACISAIVSNVPQLARVIATMYCFALGAAGTMLLTLLILRSLGYRLIGTIYLPHRSNGGKGCRTY